VNGHGTATLSSVDLSLGAGSEVNITNHSTLAFVGSTLDLDASAVVLVGDSSSVLALKDTTLNGGAYGLADGAKITISGDVMFAGTSVELNGVNSIASDGAAGTLTNAGSIAAGDTAIGDGNLTLHNEGTIEMVAINGAMTINTAGNTIVNDGTIKATTTGQIVIGSTLQNTASGKVQTGTSIVTTVGITNAGLVSADAGGRLEIKGTLTNSGQVTASGGGVLKALSLDNSGNVLSTGANSDVAIGDGSIAVTNTGQIGASDHGTLEINGGVNDVPGGQLLAQAHGQITVDGAAVGGIATLTGGGIVDFEGSATALTTTNAVFQGTTAEQLILNNSARFAGTVAGMAADDSIDVKDIAYAAGKSFYDPTKGQLDVSDGTTVVKIQLVGTYAPGAFTFSSDDHGGTLVTDQSATVDYSTASGGVYVDLAAQFTEHAPAGQGWSGGPDSVTPVSTDTLNGVRNVTGSSFDDLLVGGTQSGVLSGGAGNDTIYGNTSQLTANNAARLTLDGGTGNNELYGSSAFNTFIAGNADGGFNQIWGAASKMAGVSGFTNNTVSFAGVAAGKSIYVDLLEGHDAYINSGHQNDGTYTLEDAITDVPNVIGSSGGDVIIADNGTDRITGGAGADQLYAGSGFDTFVYTDYGDSNLVSGYDTIYGFKTGTDKVDLSALHTDASHVLISSGSASTALYVEQTPGAFNAATDLAISVVGANAIAMSDIKFG
jgi:hypothetical protein